MRARPAEARISDAGRPARGGLKSHPRHLEDVNELAGSFEAAQVLSQRLTRIWDDRPRLAPLSMRRRLHAGFVTFGVELADLPGQSVAQSFSRFNAAWASMVRRDLGRPSAKVRNRSRAAKVPIHSSAATARHCGK